MIKFIKNQPYYGTCIDKRVKFIYLGQFENLSHMLYAIFENYETHEILTLQIHNLNTNIEFVIFNEGLTVINADDDTDAKLNNFKITFDDCYLAYDYNNDVILLLGKINNNVKEALRLNEIEIIKRLTK